MTRPEPLPGTGPFRNIAIVRLSAMGDVVMALPAVEALRATYPDARISWIVEKRARNVLEGAPAVDELIDFPRNAWKELWKRPLGRLRSLPTLLRYRRDLRRGFDLSIDFQGNIKSGLVTWMAGAPVRLGYERAECREPNHLFTNRRLRVGGQQMHRMERDLLLVGQVGVPFAFKRPRLLFEAEDRRAGEELPDPGPGRPAVVLHPGTSDFMPHKRWPLESYAALADRLHAEIAPRILLSWGPGEEERVGALRRMIGAPTELLPPTPTVKSLGFLLGRADLVVGSDTGPVHLAVAMGVATLVLLGPGDPRHYYPHGHPERVFYRRMPCSPCRHRACPDLTCLGDIPVEAVARTALRVLGSGGPDAPGDFA